MVTSLATPQQVLDARHTRTRSMVFIDGVSVDCVTWRAGFDVDQVHSTARVTFPISALSNVRANAVLHIDGGHDDVMGPLFEGRIPGWNASMRRGNLLTVRAVGWSSLLAYKERFDLVFDGPISITALADAMCQRRGVTNYALDRVTDKTGGIEIKLGTNPAIDEGKVKIPANQSPLTFLNAACEPWGYRIYDTLSGTLRLSRVSGMPAADPVVRFVEGLHLVGADRDYDISGVINYPERHGPTYEDELGASIPIRAFPATVVSNPLIPVNNGVAYESRRNGFLVTQQLAEIALEVAQIDGSAPATPIKWEGIGLPGVNPGDVIEIESETLLTSQRFWLMGIDLQKPEGGGLEASYSGWAGAGEALPAGNNRTRTLIQTGVVHLGNETLTHYAVAPPNGNVSATRQKWTIVVPDRATAVAVRFWHHGTNSQLVDGVQTDIEVSQFKVYEHDADPDDDGVSAESSGKLATLTEDLAKKYPYDEFTTATNDDGEIVAVDPGYWKPGAVNLSKLDAGEWDLYLEAGETNGPDDFEARLFYLEIYGTAEPIVVPEEVA